MYLELSSCTDGTDDLKLPTISINNCLFNPFVCGRLRPNFWLSNFIIHGRKS